MNQNEHQKHSKKIHAEIRDMIAKLKKARTTLGAIGLALVLAVGFWVQDSTPFQGNVLQWATTQTTEEAIIEFGQKELEFGNDEIIISPLSQSGEVHYFQANHYLGSGAIRQYFFALSKDNNGDWQVIEYEPLH